MSLFGSHKTSTPVLTGLQVQTSSSALPIPIVYGINRLAPNVIWTGGFQTHAVNAGGKGGLLGGGASTSYDYKAALVLGLCEGPINSIGTVFSNQGIYTPAALNLSLITGTTPQTAWGYLTASVPMQALAYQGTALAVSSSFDLGSSASLGNLAFEVCGRLYTSAVVNAHDADPAQVIGDFLTNAQYGVGFPSSSISAATLYGASGDGSYQTYCQAMGLALSPCLTDQEAGNSILARWLQLTNSTAVWSGGILKFIPFGDASATGTLHSGTSITFQPNTTPVYDLSDDDFLNEDGADPVVVTRSDPYSASNLQRIEILDRAPTYTTGAPVGTPPSYYTPTPVEARDQNAIELYGLRIGSTITAHEICDKSVASVAAQLILQRGLYVRNTYAFRLSWEYCLLEPMDLVTLTDSGLGLAKTPVRIIAIEEGSDGLLAVTAEEFPGTVATTSGYAVDGAAAPAFNRSVAPAAVNTPVILEPPSDMTGGVEQLWVGLSGGTSGIADPNWGGAAIYASTDNATYTQVGSVNGAARQGVLTAAAAARRPPPRSR